MSDTMKDTENLSLNEADISNYGQYLAEMGEIVLNENISVSIYTADSRNCRNGESFKDWYIRNAYIYDKSINNGFRRKITDLPSYLRLNIIKLIIDKHYEIKEKENLIYIEKCSKLDSNLYDFFRRGEEV